MRNSHLNVAFGVLVLLVSSLGPITAATAATGDTEKHCTVEVHPLESSEPAADLVCFGTEEEVTDYLSSIGVGDTAGRGIAASTIVGTVYKDHNQGGKSLTFWGASGCAGVTFGFPSLASGLDNSISSARASNGCW